MAVIVVVVKPFKVPDPLILAKARSKEKVVAMLGSLSGSLAPRKGKTDRMLEVFTSRMRNGGPPANS